MRLYRRCIESRSVRPPEYRDGVRGDFSPLSRSLRGEADAGQRHRVLHGLGRHYVADAAQPLQNSVHHDGWSGADPKGYTRDPQIHGRFESQYVDLIAVTEEDVLKYMRKEPRLLEDVWKAVLNHSIEARDFTEDVYRLDLRGAFAKKDDAEARELVCKRLAPPSCGIWHTPPGSKAPSRRRGWKPSTSHKIRTIRNTIRRPVRPPRNEGKYRLEPLSPGLPRRWCVSTRFLERLRRRPRGNISVISPGDFLSPIAEPSEPNLWGGVSEPVQHLHRQLLASDWLRAEAIAPSSTAGS